MTIGEVAGIVRVRTSAIRFYERTGLLPPPARSNGRREYDTDAIDRLRVIGLAKRCGFSLDEIRDLVAGLDDGTAPAARWRAAAERKLVEIDALIERAEAMRALLSEGLDCGCLSLETCGLYAREAGQGAADEPHETAEGVTLAGGAAAPVRGTG